MKKFTKVLAVLALLTGFIGVASTQKDTVEVEAATTQTHRRIYAWTKDSWTYNGNVYIYYWGGVSNDFNSPDQMTLVVNDHYNGLYYFDIPIGATHFLLKDAYLGDGSNKTADVTVANLFTTTDYLILETWGGGSSLFLQTTVSLNNGQVQAILSKIDSCSNSYASGYNAWPQLDDLFITPNEGNLGFSGTYLNELSPYNNVQPTIGQKIAYLESSYTLDQSSSARLVAQNPSSNTLAVFTIGLIGVSSIAGYYFLKTKKII